MASAEPSLQKVVKHYSIPGNHGHNKPEPSINFVPPRTPYQKIDPSVNK